MRLLPPALAICVLAACEGPGFAPIKDKTQPPAKAAARPPAPPPAARPAGEHVVEKGDTLFSIAFQNGLDYRDLAFWNNLASPEVIRIGQVLRLTPPEDTAGRARGVETLPLRGAALSAPRPLASPLSAEPKAQSTAGESPAAPDAPGEWRWPAEGEVLGAFGQGGGKGIDIAGERQAPVYAAASGKVVYSGAGLRGYGKMLIVKHADEFLTAYAHNQNLLAREGEWVKGGQKIAEMGDTDSERIKLHFEVRQYGKPLDPMKYLPERK